MVPRARLAAGPLDVLPRAASRMVDGCNKWALRTAAAVPGGFTYKGSASCSLLRHRCARLPAAATAEQQNNKRNRENFR